MYFYLKRMRIALKCAKAGCGRFIIEGPDVLAEAGLCEGWAFEPEVFSWFDLFLTESTEVGLCCSCEVQSSAEVWVVSAPEPGQISQFCFIKGALLDLVCVGDVQLQETVMAA